MGCVSSKKLKNNKLQTNCCEIYCVECKINYNSNEKHCCKCKKNYDLEIKHCCSCKMLINSRYEKHCCYCKKNYDGEKHCCRCGMDYDSETHCCRCRIGYSFHERHCCQCRMEFCIRKKHCCQCGMIYYSYEKHCCQCRMNYDPHSSSDSLYEHIRRHRIISQSLIDEEIELCSICTEQINDKTNFVITQCNHKFHYNCLLKWNISNNNCPICRQIIK